MLQIRQPERTVYLAGLNGRVEWGGIARVERSGIMYRDSEARKGKTGRKLSSSRYASKPNSADSCLSVLEKKKK